MAAGPLPDGGAVSSPQNLLPPGTAVSSNLKAGQERRLGEARGSRTCPGERLLGGMMGAILGPRASSSQTPRPSSLGLLPGFFLLILVLLYLVLTLSPAGAIG